ncbi:phosphatase PAP2 family protein [Jatrophihabitans sp. GAS493]|uniref:phosphatase PAP2 family protein n=1 Tax=Jatrophihabitans sp. GAS493 TaxID=1907575 RepID=UPI0012FD3ECA|nr:phosphatase PAP2 family protein [Jatrophihabitans sp. GAS493]
MHNIALTWQQAARLGVGLVALAALGRWATASGAVSVRIRRAAGFTTPFVTEIAIIAFLYSIWQFAGTAPVFGAAGAIGRGSAIEHFEHLVHLPSEHVAQRPLLGHPLLAQAANLYYATMHFTALFVLLLWVFVRHRRRYPEVRLLLVVLTVLCFVVQLVPVAPPRLLPTAGYVDTAEIYGQSVYTAFGAIGPDQLSAMPSLHVGWSVLVALVAVTVTTSRWRWLVVAHPIITIYVVSATANHYWSDGLAAIALLALSLLVLKAGQRLSGSRRPSRSRRQRDLRDDVTEAVPAAVV